MTTHMEIMVVHSAFEDAAKIVAIVDIPVEITDDIEALEYAYRWTQNIHGSWSRGAEIDGQTNSDFNWRVKRIGDLSTHLGETLGMRSTSVRDYMSLSQKIGGRARRYRVAGMGFDRIPDVDFPMLEMEHVDE